MKKSLLKYVSISISLTLFIIIGATKSANAADLHSFFNNLTGHHDPDEIISLCFKNNGLVYILGQGYRKTDCRKNDQLIPWILKAYRETKVQLETKEPLVIPVLLV